MTAWGRLFALHRDENERKEELTYRMSEKCYCPRCIRARSFLPLPNARVLESREGK